MSITIRLKPIEDSREPMLSVYDSIMVTERRRLVGMLRFEKMGSWE
jgi:hypothetical protein